MNTVVILDFMGELKKETLYPRSKSDAFRLIGCEETASHNQALEGSSLEKPYVRKIKDRRFGIIIPKAFIDSPSSYVDACVKKLEKKYGLSAKE